MTPSRQSIFYQENTLSEVFSYRWFNAALFFFLLVSLLGTLMRYFYIQEIPFLDYRNILHAHSHTALLGWAFMLTSGCMLFLIIKKVKSERPYWLVLVLNVFACCGMAVGFLLQGYGLFSIGFSTLHILTAYLFGWIFLKDLALQPPSPSSKFIRWSIYWMGVSTLGIWAIAPLISIYGKSHVSHYWAEHFFLHFQFNGWFTYAVLGIWIHQLHESGKNINIKSYIFWLLQFSLLLTYALSVTWSTPLSLLFYLNSLGVMLQAVVFYFILKELFKSHNPFRQLNHWIDWMFMLGILCLLGKVVVHLMVAIPSVAQISYTIRNYIIGFIHLIMLGSVTFTLVALLLKKSFFPSNNLAKYGWLLLGSGFILKEVVLLGQGTLLWMKKGFVPYYDEIIFGVTVLLPVSLFIIFIGYNAKFSSIKLRNHYII